MKLRYLFVGIAHNGVELIFDSDFENEDNYREFYVGYSKRNAIATFRQKHGLQGKHIIIEEY